MDTRLSAQKARGLGIPDLANFARALRLHWLWLKWTDNQRQWSGFPVTVTQTELELFRTCTSITIGNGESTSFWKDRWLNGQAPKDIAPLCYALAWRKNQNVARSLQHKTWMQGLQRINTTEALHQFITLWEKLCLIQLTQQPDQIKWRFTADGNYSSGSAYAVQFKGSHPDFTWSRIWKLKVENKCKFFLWLLLPWKIMTEGRIISRGGQANPICQLCRIRPETILHLAANCSYTQSVWSMVSQQTGHQILMGTTSDIKTWWSNLISDSSDRNQTITYTIWNIWKERCRRFYDNKALTAPQLTGLIRQDVAALQAPAVN